MINGALKNFRTIGWVLLSVGGALGAGLLWINSAPPSSVGGRFEVPAGAGAAAVSRRLAEGGFVRSATWVRVWSRLTGADGRLKAGLYRLAAGRPASGLLRDLVNGRGEMSRLTIPEGWALWQIAVAVEKADLCSASDFLLAAQGREGFLFPDTYYFESGVTADKVVAALMERFEQVWRDLRPTVDPHPDAVFQDEGGRRWTVRQLVTLASLIERETRLPEERPRVSAVYRNRLIKRMRLECDPTVQYALGYWKNPLWRKDLAIDHPYNTYRRYGLPPGPICSPGRGALDAALVPLVDDALYFVADVQGGHRFSRTYEEHLRAVKARRRALAASKKS